jgi:LytS/YehU family sensor histidine kinase
MVLLEGQALRAQMNPHFIFNSLNAIHDFIAEQDQRSAHLYLSKFAALIRRILELSRKHEVSLNEEIETLNLYIELENLRFENKFEYTLNVDTRDDPFDLVIPPMLLQPYVENAIRHGLQNKTDKGRLEVDIIQRNDFLLCRIKDNGIGRKATQGGKNITKHRSHGLDITSERIDIFNQKGQSARANVKFTDLEDSAGNALGTMVELNIPLKKNYTE